MSGVCLSGSIDLFLFVSCPFVKSFPLWEVNIRLPTAFSLVARNRSFSTPQLERNILTVPTFMTGRTCWKEVVGFGICGIIGKIV